MQIIASNITTRNRTIAGALKQRPIEAAAHQVSQKTRRERVELLQGIAKQCLAAKANILDINLQQRYDRPEVMKFIVDTVQAVSDAQLCLSSNRPETLDAGLAACKQPPIVNNVSLDQQQLTAILPLVARYNASVILVPTIMAAPGSAENILASAAALVGAANEAGISNDRIVIDPGVFHVTSDIGQRHLKTLTDLLPAIAEAFDPPVRTTCWINNISAGITPRLRPVVNRVFLAVLAGLGLSSAFVDVLDKDAMRTVRIVSILRGNLIYSDRELELR